MVASRYTPTDIGGFTIDAAVREIHSYDCEVSQYPVEDGSVISDHVRKLPIGLSLDGIVTDTPIGEAMEKVRGSIGSFQGEGFTQWSDEAHEHFKLLRAKGEPFTVTTALQTYYNMVIEKYTPDRSPGDGFSLRFNMVLKFIGIVTNERTVVAVASPNLAKKQKLGTKPTKVPPESLPLGIQLRDGAKQRAADDEAARKKRNSWLGNGIESLWGPSKVTGS